jgi:hypothetical protein
MHIVEYILGHLFDVMQSDLIIYLYLEYIISQLHHFISDNTI